MGFKLYYGPGFALAVLAGHSAAGALPFASVTAEHQVVSREQLFDGIVEAVKQTTVSAQTSGRVLEILNDVDDFVTKGEVILRLRDTDQRARLEKAEASLAEARARYAQANAGYERVKGIYEQKLVYKSAYDKALAERDSARARLEAAKAAVVQAREQLEYTIVRAPYSGVVTERHVEMGEAVQPGQALMSGLSLERLRVQVAVPQRLINAVRNLRKSRVIIDPAMERAVAAQGLTFFPYADRHTNTFQVRVQLPEGVQGLFPGMFVKVAFVTGERSRLVVPVAAVVYRSEVTGVYVMERNGRVAFRQIRAGRRTADGEMEVLAGLNAGETVALEAHTGRGLSQAAARRWRP
jgi:RND family efflux transporter MFP subunit